MAKKPADKWVFTPKFYYKDGKEAKDAISILQHDWEMRENYISMVIAERIAIAEGVLIAALIIKAIAERMMKR